MVSVCVGWGGSVSVRVSVGVVVDLDGRPGASWDGVGLRSQVLNVLWFVNNGYWCVNVVYT